MSYKIGRIYRIIKIDDPFINYIGSTFSELKIRWNHHKNTTSNCCIKKYFDKYGIDKFKIILIKEYEVYAETQKDNKQLRAYEQIWINKFRAKKCCINRQDAINYLKNEKNYILRLDYQKKWYEDNKERNKEYYENNKDKVKEYYENNKTEISQKRKKKVICSICNSSVRIYDLKKHQRTKKCSMVYI